MITAPKTANVTSSGIQEAVSFGIKSDGLAHIFNVLRNQLYSDKILAVMREYSANAVDANVEAGKPLTPITVTLPNRMNLNFKVRDNGFGLSDEDIREVYAFYGESTKRNSNALIGQLGLGSKSAFAYGDNFVINSFIGGKMSSYNAFIDDSQVGQIAKLGTFATSEPDGVEIVIAVRVEDINSFTEKAKSLYKHFKVRPEIKGATVEFKDATYVIEGDGWKAGGNEKNAVAVMGNIAYPIDCGALNLRGDEGDKVYGLVNQIGMAILFDIGDLDVSASREKLQYTKRTIDAIVARLSIIRVDMGKVVSKRFDDCKNLYDAKCLYSEFFDYYGVLHGLNSIVKNVTWNGTKIDSNDIFVNTAAGSGVVLRKYAKSFRGTKINSTECDRIRCSRSSVVIYNDLNIKNGIVNRVHTLVTGNAPSQGGSAKNEILVVTTSDLAKFLAETKLEKSNLVMLSSLPHVSFATATGSTGGSTGGSKSTKHTSKAFIFDASKVSQWTSTLSNFWKEADVDLTNDGGVYVEIERFEFRISKDASFQPPTRLTQFKNLLAAAGITVPIIYGFKRDAMDKVAKNKNFVNFAEFAQAALTKILAKDNLSQKVIDRIEYNSHKSTWWGYAVGTISKVGMFKTNTDKIAHCCGTKADIKAVTAATEVCTAMGVAIKGDATYNLKEVNEVVAAKYPMMSYLEHIYAGTANLKNLTDYINLVDAAS